MSIRTGNDEFTYEIVEGWGMSSGTGIDGAFDIAGVGVDVYTDIIGLIGGFT
jgi:hypothetical protein